MKMHNLNSGAKCFISLEVNGASHLVRVALRFLALMG